MPIVIEGIGGGGLLQNVAKAGGTILQGASLASQQKRDEEQQALALQAELESRAASIRGQDALTEFRNSEIAVNTHRMQQELDALARDKISSGKLMQELEQAASIPDGVFGDLSDESNNAADVLASIKSMAESGDTAQARRAFHEFSVDQFKSRALQQQRVKASKRFAEIEDLLLAQGSDFAAMAFAAGLTAQVLIGGGIKAEEAGEFMRRATENPNFLLAFGEGGEGIDMNPGSKQLATAQALPVVFQKAAEGDAAGVDAALAAARIRPSELSSEVLGEIKQLMRKAEEKKRSEKEKDKLDREKKGAIEKGFRPPEGFKIQITEPGELQKLRKQMETPRP